METLALLGHNHHPMSKTLPLLGLLQPAKCAKKAQHAALCSRKCPASPGWRPIQLGQRLNLQGADPHRPGLCQNVLMRASFFSVHGLVITLSYLCHPNVHLMGSSAPWRSELIISPCVPVQGGTCPSGMIMHINNYALHGMISHMDHSNVNHISSVILSNICIKTLIYH